MGIVKRLLRRLGIRDGRFAHLRGKQYAEMEYWAGLIERCVDWYRGSVPSLYGKPAPSDDAKVKGYGPRENAIRTWFNVVGRKYLDALRVDEDYFNGMSVLDVGCGPTPHLMAFRDCRRFGLDQLIDEFRAVGYPMERHSPDLTYLKGSAEDVPAEDGAFDAVVSVNAIDHVDDLGGCAREIARVLRPGGVLRMQVHYHKPTATEPHELGDDAVVRHFGRLGIRKVHEGAAEAWPYGRLAVWSTRG